jgi:hypothetical protein
LAGGQIGRWADWQAGGQTGQTSAEAIQFKKIMKMIGDKEKEKKNFSSSQTSFIRFRAFWLNIIWSTHIWFTGIWLAVIWPMAI